jgi:hypothetical protein
VIPQHTYDPVAQVDGETGKHPTHPPGAKVQALPGQICDEASVLAWQGGAWSCQNDDMRSPLATVLLLLSDLGSCTTGAFPQAV